MRKITGNRAFSLVELVIVIVILGIVAAIAVPRISSASKNSGETALKANLNTIRTAIDLYFSQHGSTYPGAKADGLGNALNSSASLINQLTLYTDIHGNCSASKSSSHPYGPYLRSGFPAQTIGPNAGLGSIAAEILVLPSANKLLPLPGVNHGWVYSSITGKIIPNISATETDDTGILYVDY